MGVVNGTELLPAYLNCRIFVLKNKKWEIRGPRPRDCVPCNPIMKGPPALLFFFFLLLHLRVVRFA